MKKTWITLALILCITSQIIALSLFHQVNATEFSGNNAVVTVSKLNYVEAIVKLTVSPSPGSNVEIVFPNGQTVNLTRPISYGSNSQTFTQMFSFPRTGDLTGNIGTSSGEISLSTDNPLSLVINTNMSDVENYRSPLSHTSNVDTLVFIIYGDAFVSVDCYGVAL
ncbi:MAG: hypothetical protein ACFCUE_15225 [Candidatus Bathyarchaeia archaeon]|jgi:hypothetical protein